MISTPRFVTFTATALILSVASCARNQTARPPASAGGRMNEAPAPGVATPSNARSGSPTGQSGAPAPPAGTQFTIYCATIPGAGHIQQSTQFRDQLARSTGMHDWYVVHKQDE